MGRFSWQEDFEQILYENPWYFLYIFATFARKLWNEDERRNNVETLKTTKEHWGELCIDKWPKCDPQGCAQSSVRGFHHLPFWKKGDIFQGIQEIKHLHLEQLHPTFLFGLDALLHLRVGLDAHAPEGGHVLLAVLGFGLGVRQLDNPQARVPQTARQSHELRQREGHHGGLRPTCGDVGLICFLL